MSERATLFQVGNFSLHSGQATNWKIECDALTCDDWHGLAMMAVEILPPFGPVVGVPRGGYPLQYALQEIGSHGHNLPRLIVDDVLTTGASMQAAMDRPSDIGLVVFARGALPPRVTALFAMPNPRTHTDA